MVVSITPLGKVYGLTNNGAHISCLTSGIWPEAGNVVLIAACNCLDSFANVSDCFGSEARLVSSFGSV